MMIPRALNESAMDLASAYATGLPMGGVTSAWNVATRTGWPKDEIAISIPEKIEMSFEVIL